MAGWLNFFITGGDKQFSDETPEWHITVMTGDQSILLVLNV